MPNKPWLYNEQWAARKIVCARPVGGCVFMLAIIFFGIPGVLLMIFHSSRDTSHANIFLGGILLVVFGLIVYMWGRGVKYGDSVCRLKTLPGVIGGWFKADVECSLPTDSPGPVTVQLKNLKLVNRDYSCTWEMAQKVEANKVVSAGAGRSIVQIRLKVPRHSGQAPLSLNSPADRHLIWKLVVKKDAPGIDFVAEFDVPIYDISDAPESEQRPE
jgi:hypothetical protein